MRDTWYADRRDLVKWGTLVHIARTQSFRLIVQVGFLRSDARNKLHTPEGNVDIAAEVWEFFRDVNSVKGLGAHLGCRIEVFDIQFEPDRRRDYRRKVVDFLQGLQDRKVVLLDPDTGIEPKKVRPEHVSMDDVKEVWTALRSGDSLALYQHRYRRPGWQDEVQEKFAKACGVQIQKIEKFSAIGIAPDVVFFVVNKPLAAKEGARRLAGLGGMEKRLRPVRRRRSRKVN